MTLAKTKVLLIGSSGFLGSTLLQQLPSPEIQIDTVDRTILDLSKPISAEFKSLLKTNGYTYIIICAAITNVERCFTEQHVTSSVNVEGTQNLLTLSAQYGLIPVFFSSDYVFHGTQISYTETDKRQPATIYGQQKLFIENYLEKNIAKYIILRTSKLMSKTAHPKNILSPITQQLSEGKTVHCFEDQWLNPVFVEDIAYVLQRLIHKQIYGTFHLGTDKVFSRLQLGKLIAKALNQNPDLVRPIKMADLKLSEARPTHNVLDCKKIKELISFEFCELEDYLWTMREVSTLNFSSSGTQ